MSLDDSEWSRWMDVALDLARRAGREGEVPIGAVVVRQGELLGEGFNRTEQLIDPVAHAEIAALRRAAARTGNWRLTDAALITTLEPCVMCFGALLEARIGTLVVGAGDSRRGATPLWKSGHLSSYPARPLKLIEGVEEGRCQALLKEWFVQRRAGAVGPERFGSFGAGSPENQRPRSD
ncbi:MAG: nucleoside deaminase [Planctomycetes bacterium]|nr:nucleoside deaminase [Planctomycetota bacterium]